MSLAIALFLIKRLLVPYITYLCILNESVSHPEHHNTPHTGRLVNENLKCTTSRPFKHCRAKPEVEACESAKTLLFEQRGLTEVC